MREIFLYAYDLIRKENDLNRADWYTDEGKKLAGIDKIEDIEQMIKTEENRPNGIIICINEMKLNICI